eukprot:gene11487-13576_t
MGCFPAAEEQRVKAGAKGRRGVSEQIVRPMPHCEHQGSSIVSMPAFMRETYNRLHQLDAIGGGDEVLIYHRDFRSFGEVAMGRPKYLIGRDYFWVTGDATESSLSALFVSGLCWVAKRAALQEVVGGLAPSKGFYGGLPPLMYADLGLRLQEQGHTLEIDPNSQVVVVSRAHIHPDDLNDYGTDIDTVLDFDRRLVLVEREGSSWVVLVEREGSSWVVLVERESSLWVVLVEREGSLWVVLVEREGSSWVDWFGGLEHGVVDVKALAQTLQYVYRHPEAARRVGEQGRHDVEQFFSPRVVGDIIVKRLKQAERPPPKSPCRVRQTIDQEGWQRPDLQATRVLPGFLEGATTRACSVGGGFGRPARSKGSKRVLVISSYPPRECGIAVFASNLVAGLNKRLPPDAQVSVMALTTEDDHLLYPREVIHKIRHGSLEDVDTAARVFITPQHHLTFDSWELFGRLPISTSPHGGSRICRDPTGTEPSRWAQLPSG